MKCNLPSIQRDNTLTMVIIGNITLWFSYDTVVAFRMGATKVVSENRWSNATGKHLNQIDGGDKKNRVSREEFERLYEKLIGELGSQTP